MPSNYYILTGLVVHIPPPAIAEILCWDAHNLLILWGSIILYSTEEPKPWSPVKYSFKIKISIIRQNKMCDLMISSRELRPLTHEDFEQLKYCYKKQNITKTIRKIRKE